MEHMQHQVDEHQHLIEYLAIDQQEQITQLLIQLLHLLQKSLIQTVITITLQIPVGLQRHQQGIINSHGRELTTCLLGQL
jgi:hypothetical protein